jgi:hypothetical protein
VNCQQTLDIDLQKSNLGDWRKNKAKSTLIPEAAHQQSAQNLRINAVIIHANLGKKCPTEECRSDEAMSLCLMILARESLFHLS